MAALTTDQIGHALEHLKALYVTRGARTYSGEPVSHTQHALQAAHLAQQQGADDRLVAAALLHDVGHLLDDTADTPSERGVDDLHQYRGAKLIQPLFGRAVADTIRLHVHAKRYLCAVEFGYAESLSEDSRRSLGLQGGAFNAHEAAAFAQTTHAAAALALRRWDDEAKTPGLPTPSFDDFMPMLERCAREANAC